MMRTLAVILIAVMIAGCTTTRSRTRRSSYDSVSARPAMVIHQNDAAPVRSAVVKAEASSPRAKTALKHTIKNGETLWSISKLYGVDVEVVKAANSIHDSRAVDAGRVLTIPGDASRRSRKSLNYGARRNTTFIWPVRGGVVSNFGSKIDKSLNKGIDIRTSKGVNVKASRSGKVVYCDPHLKGFGQTVIIDHLDGFQTVYSYNDDISVKVGDMVEQRDIIARVGDSGRAREPMLHFEIRKNGEPLNPEFYLPR